MPTLSLPVCIHLCPHRFKPGPTTGASPRIATVGALTNAVNSPRTHNSFCRTHYRPALALPHTCAVANRICHMASPCAIALVLFAQPITDTRHRHSSPTLVPHHHPHSSHSSPSPTPSPILARALVVINLLTNTLYTILHQPPAPPLQQPPTAVVSRRQHHHQQQQQQPTTLCRW